MGADRRADSGGAMILQKIYSVPRQAWLLLAIVATYITLTTWLLLGRVVPYDTVRYVVAPVGAAILALITRQVLGGRRDHLRHKTDKMIMIGSTLSIWFVVYFMSGIIATYTRNSLVVDFKSFLFNLLGFAVVAVFIEYTRYGLMLLSGRRNVVWFGTVVALVFAFQYMSLGQLAYAKSGQDVVELLVSDFIPAIMMSLLLTYISFTCGLGSQLVLRLGVVTSIIVPPILPKYDWYLLGMANIALVMAVYTVLDRSRDDRERDGRPKRNHERWAVDVTSVVVMLALIAFMTGMFSYKPNAIMSNSMNPVFYRGDMVVIQKRHAMDIRIGDILQYETPGKTVTHRVIAMDKSPDNSGEKVFITKGDNNPNPDSALVYEKQVTGVVKARIPYIGYPTVWLRSLKR